MSLTKPAIAARAAERGRPISGALASTVLTVTGGCPTTVDIAIDAARQADSDESVTRVVADAVYEHQVRQLRDLDSSEQDVVALVHFGIGHDVEVLTELSDGSDAASVLEQALASGVLAAGPLPGVDRALREVLGARRLSAVLTTLLEFRLKTETLDASTALTLSRNGIQHPSLARFLAAAADAAEPDDAALLYAGAVDAGADPLPVAARRAEASAALGDFDAAEQLCDTVLENSTSVDVDDLRRAVRVSATVAAERGMTARSVQLFEWLGPERLGADADLARTVSLVGGVLPASDTDKPSAPPTSATAAVALLATGLEQSVAARSTADVVAATNTLMRSVSLSRTSIRRVAPENAASTSVLFALHSGDLARAESIAARAADQLPPRHPAATRIALLRIWTAMLAGDTQSAASGLDAVKIPASHTRSLFFAHALRVGLARRSGDAGALLRAWDDAQDVVAAYAADLLSLLPVGELWLAAVRLGRPEAVSHLVAQAQLVVEMLDEPPAWSSALHWYGVQAAILAENPPALVPHAKVLAAAAESNRYSAALAGAGRAWLAVLQGHPDVADVESAARSLAGVGLSWDGARLASEAALRVEDTRVATALLQIARSLRQPVAAPTATTVEPKGSLSAREAEVAELLVLGITYREAGSRLYISAKTVEHHVARIRRRLGAGSRSELLSMLRAMGYGSSGAEV
ncbi:LuxR family transcriptional regulator [Rhodococcus sp. BP-252]|uniref:LuxR C-terminal-related transcriptional regulator n=1 Tax=unclassified Rhodococcus (in: high G+C Gram-positive bacteria) TaxID=192944 RepID=UPI001C9B9173|nr:MULTISPECIES: LuxR C-terminal-related transcriptional regulator [unclassified Rhodococcus (in: high G+C Gram-positive bacteria)]MBY6412209.1 LuxR family transcriptional regulator [Rhodococcus sp. BP-320]MBY6416789.1 LuxR family transcriptional regulator [Rhodococcus sp. BP-321]MBY6421673.1 LuxR family transcriptional regulator [Rhodococcus sp. BP-324]MBY6426939.1 LuxR family transcriptional regulator [Rhodococcus sp. BP-323]MBY6432105.1 LuxR family transcriptional regulator [Rhodococcus sp.